MEDYQDIFARIDTLDATLAWDTEIKPWLEANGFQVDVQGKFYFLIVGEAIHLIRYDSEAFLLRQIRHLLRRKGLL